MCIRDSFTTYNVSVPRDGRIGSVSSGTEHIVCNAKRMAVHELAVILDFHCFVDVNGNELVKEPTVMDVTAFATRHWIFAPPADTIVSNHKHARTNRWLTEHFHGLVRTDGDTSYEHLVSILVKHTFPFNYVFVKGLEKKDFWRSVSSISIL